MLVQFFVEIFPVALAKRKPCAEEDDAVDVFPDACVQNGKNVLFSIVYKGKYGRQSYDGGNSAFFQRLHNLDSF